MSRMSSAEAALGLKTAPMGWRSIGALLFAVFLDKLWPWDAITASWIAREG